MWIERLMAGISHQHVLSYNPIMKLGFDLYFEMWKKGEISIRKAV